MFYLGFFIGYVIGILSALLFLYIVRRETESVADGERLCGKEKRVIAGIVCQTCGTTMSLHRGRFPICDDCLKVLREIIKERKSNG